MDLAGDVRRVLDTLDAHAIPHMLVGGFAQEALGVPRATFHVDVQVSLPSPPSPADSVWLGWLVEERTKDPVFGQDVLIVHVPLSSVPFELFVTDHWLTRQALERRRLLPSALLQRDVPVPRVEEFVLMKAAHMASPSRSPRKAAQDALDIEAVLAAHEGALDRQGMERDARRLGVWERVAPLLE